MKIDSDLEEFIKKFAPDIIYIEPLFFRENKLALDIARKFNIKIIVHFMDDSFNHQVLNFWPLWFYALITRKTLRELIKKSAVKLAISDEMAGEYRRRFKAKFKVFRNIVDQGDFKKFAKKNYKNSRNFSIVYTGSAAGMFKKPFKALSKTLILLNKKGIRVTLDAFTQLNHRAVKKILLKNPYIKLKKPVFYKDIPKLLPKYDLILLLSSFDKLFRKYIKYSFSTRTFENMFSRVPTLVFAPKDCAQYLYAAKTKSAFLVGEVAELSAGLEKIILNPELRAKMATKALSVAEKDCNAEKISEQFRNALSV